ncbi:MAG: hypothetical protein QGH33_01380 [Pirellulaceae bacterium]|nr:hypothetical protein [Pirellulaceae bacterium]MDP7302420.1 hypothetical protein [Pirellulaceae bacterium]HJN08377.1 hypothetical protein [Pirellulaceae bacterium]
MSTTIETVSVLNSAVRTVLGLVIVGGLGYGGWYGYSVYNEKDEATHRATKQLAEAKSALTRAQNDNAEKDRSLAKKNVELQEKTVQISTLNVKVDEQEQEITRLDTSLRLLKVDHRVARLTVLDQSTNAENEVISLVEFQELDENGEPLDEPKQFRILGDMVYVDTWVVKFDDKYVEEADIDRGTALVFFRRLFGEFQEPKDGFALDQAGQRPTAYARGSALSEFEKRIWDDFWNVANNEIKQAELGIRAIHGDAPSFKVTKGTSYRIELRATGELSFKAEPTLPRTDPPT